MEQVTIYGRSSCGFCVQAKRLCEARNIPYVWVDMIEKGMISRTRLAGRFIPCRRFWWATSTWVGLISSTPTCATSNRSWPANHLRVVPEQ